MCNQSLSSAETDQRGMSTDSRTTTAMAEGAATEAVKATGEAVLANTQAVEAVIRASARAAEEMATQVVRLVGETSRMAWQIEIEEAARRGHIEERRSMTRWTVGAISFCFLVIGVTVVSSVYVVRTHPSVDSLIGSLHGDPDACVCAVARFGRKWVYVCPEPGLCDPAAPRPAADGTQGLPALAPPRDRSPSPGTSSPQPRILSPRGIAPP